MQTMPATALAMTQEIFIVSCLNSLQARSGGVHLIDIPRGHYGKDKHEYSVEHLYAVCREGHWQGLITSFPSLRLMRTNSGKWPC